MIDPAIEDFFLHGGDYPKTTEEPRTKCCITCAFNKTGPTVRPAGVTVDQIAVMSENYDGFVCHEPLEDGTHPRCAAWHKLHGRNL